MMEISAGSQVHVQKQSNEVIADQWQLESLEIIRHFRPTKPTKQYLGGRRSPAVACWASDHWVVGSNPLRGKFRH